jgi:hypothetical protein
MNRAVGSSGDLRFETGDLRFSKTVLRIKRGMHLLSLTPYPSTFPLERISRRQLRVY